MPKCCEEFHIQIEALIKKGLGSKDLATQFLQHLDREKMANLFLDFDLPKPLFDSWCKSLKLSEKTGEQILKIQKTGLLKDFLLILNDKKVSETALRTSLVQLATTQKPIDLIDFLNDHDFNTYEIYRLLNGHPPATFILDELKSPEQKTKKVLDLWREFCAPLDLQDQLTILFTSVFDANAWNPFFSAIGLKKDSHETFSPAKLAREIKDPAKLNKHLEELLAGVKKADFISVLKSRALAQSIWFQSVGPNVLGGFSGVLHKKVPTLPNREGIKPSAGVPLKFPDFQIILYRDQTVKAHHIGPDLLTSKKDLVYTINHAYFGCFDPKESLLVLEEVSQYETTEKRPSLGAIELSNLDFSNDGLTLSCQWKEKKIKLRWDPGF